MKRFTVPCSFGDTTAPFNLYIGHPLEGYHPLYFQAAWLSEERGGVIPVAVMESFAKLLKIARENNVSFEELCMYALNATEEKKEGDGEAATDADRPPPESEAEGDGSSSL